MASIMPFYSIRDLGICKFWYLPGLLETPQRHQWTTVIQAFRYDKKLFITREHIKTISKSFFIVLIIDLHVSLHVLIIINMHYV